MNLNNLPTWVNGQAPDGSLVAPHGGDPFLSNSGSFNGTSTSNGGSGGNIIETALPGAGGLTSLATNNVRNLLNGMPSTSAARKANAVFGAGSGLGYGSDFSKTRLYDTYGENVDQRNQTGLQDLLALISGTTSPLLSQNAQNNQSSQFAQSLAQQKAEFAAKLKQQQDQFNQQNDLALQQFGFNKSRYYSGANKPQQGLKLYPNSVVSQSMLDGNG